MKWDEVLQPLVVTIVSAVTIFLNRRYVYRLRRGKFKAKTGGGTLGGTPNRTPEKPRR